MAYKKLTTDQACQIEQQAGNEAAALIDELLDNMSIVTSAPSTNGTYYLKCVKSNSGATFSWATLPEAEE